MTSDDFPTWRSLTLGQYKDAATYRVALEAGGYRISDYVSKILAEMPIATTKTAVDLVRRTVREMGFPRGASIPEIYAWAQAHDLKKCPAEVGPALRLAYADQPFEERIRVGMEPITDSGGNLSVFGVIHVAGVRWLSTYWTDPAGHCDPERAWAFLRI